MVIFFGIFVLLLLCTGVLLILALLRWLVLVGITVLFCICFTVLAIGDIAGFGVFQTVGAGYGPLRAP